jgi:hypothetical protein
MTSSKHVVVAAGLELKRQRSLGVVRTRSMSAVNVHYGVFNVRVKS